jgi:tetratricopeptide (TPR) repeat protein
MAHLRETMALVLPLTEGSSHPLLALTGPMLALLGGDLDGMRRSLEATASHPDPWLRAAQRMLSGQLALNDGDIDGAAACLAEADAVFREIGDRWGLMVCLTGMAEVEMAKNKPAEAVRLLEEARANAAGGLALNFGEMMCVPLGRARARAGDAAGARADLRHAVAVAERIGEHDDEAAGYLVLSELARREGDLTAARGLVGRALEVIEPRSTQPGMHSVAALAYSASGCVAEQDGDIEAARRWHARAIGTLNGSEIANLPMNPALAAVVEGFAALAAARGEHARSAELLGLAHTLRGYRDELSLELARAGAANTAALGEAAAATAYERGRGLSREDALALVP